MTNESLNKSIELQESLIQEMMKLYSDEMREFLIDGSCFEIMLYILEIMLYILFALFWMVSVPCVLLCMLFGWLEAVFEKFFKSILS